MAVISITSPEEEEKKKQIICQALLLPLIDLLLLLGWPVLASLVELMGWEGPTER